MPRRSSKPNQAVLSHLAKSIRRLRRENDMTQERLAEIADLHPRMVQLIEAADANLTLGTLAQLRKAFKCRWDDLLPPD